MSAKKYYNLCVGIQLVFHHWPFYHNGTLHQGERGRIDIYARVTWSILDPERQHWFYVPHASHSGHIINIVTRDPILTLSLEHKCQYALFHPDVMCQSLMYLKFIWLKELTHLGTNIVVKFFIFNFSYFIDNSEVAFFLIFSTEIYDYFRIRMAHPLKTTDWKPLFCTWIMNIHTRVKTI